MVFGHEFSGEIVQIGADVKNFRVGDRVAGETHIPCGQCEQCKTGNAHICAHMRILGVHSTGAFAEYVPVHKDCLWKLHDDLDFETGALLEPMGVGVHGLLSGEIGAKTVAILGCGPIGLCAIGAARAWGASKIFAMDLQSSKLEWAARLGADILLNSASQDVQAIVQEQTAGKGIDVVIDYTGSPKAIQLGLGMLKRGGRFTFVGLTNEDVAINVNDAVIYKEARLNGTTGRLMYKTWYDCENLLLSKKFDVKQIIGGIYPLKDFEKAFDALKSGAPGKMLLIP